MVVRYRGTGKATGKNLYVPAVHVWNRCTARSSCLVVVRLESLKHRASAEREPRGISRIRWVVQEPPRAAADLDGHHSRGFHREYVVVDTIADVGDLRRFEIELVR